MNKPTRNKPKRDATLNALTQLEEFEGLSQLASRFSDAMRARLWEKLEEGYKGWTNKKRIKHLTSRINAALDDYNVSVSKGNPDKLKLIDIANLAAIIWLHHG